MGCGKRSYLSQELAEEALIAAWTAFDYSEGHGPVAVYLCEDCGSYHLTSRGPMNERLASAIAGGEIGREKQAEKWTQRIRRRR